MTLFTYACFTIVNAVMYKFDYFLQYKFDYFLHTKISLFNV